MADNNLGVASDARDLLRRFCAGWGDEASDDDLLDYFAEDATYHDPHQDLVGRQALAARFRRPVRPERTELRIVNIADNGDVVLVEHSLVQEFSEFRVQVQGMSAFELRDGKITRRTLYVDPREIARQSGNLGDW